MYSFYEKHGQKVLVVACTLLMLAFLLPSGNGGGCNGDNGRYFREAKLDGKAFTVAMYNQAANDITLLQNIGKVDTDPTTGAKRPMPLMFALFRLGMGLDDNTYRQAFENPQMYYLLCNEAEQAGCYISEDIVSSLSRQGVGVIRKDMTVGDIEKDFDVDALAQVKATIKRAFMVREAFLRQMRGLKASKPLIDQLLAQRFQDISVRLVEYNASDFAAQAPAPTEQQIVDHFNQYKSFLANPVSTGIEDPKNRMGFGYLVPAKVKLQYIAVDNAAIRAHIYSSKTPFEWKEEAAAYYQRNKSRFLVEPTKQPATTQATAAAPTSGPTYQSFAEVESKITEDILRPLVDDKRRAMLNKISSVMQKDFEDASTKATTQAVGGVVSSLGMPYGSSEYLVKLSDDILRQFSIRPKVVELGKSLSQKDIVASELNSAYVVGNGLDGMLSVDQFVFGKLRDFSNNKQNQSAVFDVYQPLPIFEDLKAGYVVRATASEQAHAPVSVDEVREQVVADLKQVLTYQYAETTLRAKVDLARNRGLTEVAAGRPIFVSQTPITAEDEVIPGYDSKLPWARDLRKVCGELLRAIQSPSQLPFVDVVGVPRYGKVVMLEISNVKTHLDTNMEPYFRVMASQQISAIPQYAIPTLAANWFDTKAIEKRSNFVVVAAPNSLPAGDDAPTAPPSPFKP